MKTTVKVNEVDRVVVTTLSDGAQVYATPTDDAESRARAIALGYSEYHMRDAVWKMTADHERLHTLVAEAEGKTASIALWYAAHKGSRMDPIAQEAAHREECIVLLIQRLLNVGIAEVFNGRD